MPKHTIKICPARKPYPSYTILDIEIEKKWAEFFWSLPHHCVPDCCGYGGMIFDAESIEQFYPKICSPRFQDWLTESIKLIESHQNIKYVDSSEHHIGGGDPMATLDLFKTILSYLKKKGAQPVT